MSIIETLKIRREPKTKKAIVVTIDELIEYRQWLKENGHPIENKFFGCDLILEITKEQKKATIIEWSKFCTNYRFTSFDELLNKYLND